MLNHFLLSSKLQVSEMLHRAHTTADTVLRARFHNTVPAREVYVSIRKAPTEEHAPDMNNT